MPRSPWLAKPESRSCWRGTLYWRGKVALAAGATERAATTASEVLGCTPFEAAYAEGSALPVDRAVALALDEGPTRRETATLSRREQQIAGLVARGLTNRRIAEDLVIQERTVANHLQRIYGKLGLTGRVLLAAWALAQGLT